MDWKPLGNALVPGKIAGPHECAIVLAIDPALAEQIIRMRSSLIPFAAPDQLDPHITLLFCGVRSPREIGTLDAIARAFSQATIAFELGGPGTFADASGHIANLHLRVRSPELDIFHRQVVHRYRAAGFDMRSRHVLDRYVPHISVVDRTEIDPSAAADAVIGPVSPGPHRAGGCHLIGEAAAS